MAITRTEYTLVTNDNGYVTRGEVRSRETTYVGCVIDTYTRVERVMSDIYADVSYATVWDRAAQRTRSVHLKAWFELTDHVDVDVEVDLSEEVKAEMRAVAEQAEARAAEAEAKAAQEREAKRQAEPRKGVKVVVVKSAKGLPAVGTEGQCIWTGTCRYTGDPRMGMKVGGEVYWGPTACVERTGRAKPAKAAPKPKAQPKPATSWDHLDYEDNEIDF